MRLSAKDIVTGLHDLGGEADPETLLARVSPRAAQVDSFYEALREAVEAGLVVVTRPDATIVRIRAAS